MSGQTDFFRPRGILGIDESGKGDFFGPLVVAGVLADENQAERLAAHGVRDSKTLTDKRVLTLADWIGGEFVHNVVVIGPEKYNQLYARIKNLNRLLAWGHSRVIENVAAECDIERAISDKFGKTEFIERALMEKGRKINLEQIVRGEAIIQVAAASILARAGFIRFMDNLGSQYERPFPKGASGAVDEAARKLVKAFGPEILEKTAKVHFKNYQKVMG